VKQYSKTKPKSSISVAILLIAISFFISGCGGREFSEDRFPKREVNINGESYGFRIYAPSNVEGKHLPVMLYLHGSNRRGNNNADQIADIADVIEKNPSNFNFIVVFPQCQPETYWAGPMMEQALAALDQTVKEFNGDEHRLYLAGYSMGGFGTWQVAITHPDKFAALVPVAGGIEPMGKVSDEDHALLSPEVTAAASSPDPFRAFAEALRAMPVWIVHGNKDDAVPVEQSRRIAEALKAAGDTDVNYVELDGVNHASVKPAFSDPKLFQWLEKHSTK